MLTYVYSFTHCHLKSTVLIGLAFLAYVNNVQLNIRKKVQQLLFCTSTARNMQRRSFVFVRFGTNGLKASVLMILNIFLDKIVQVFRKWINAFMFQPHAVQYLPITSDGHTFVYLLLRYRYRYIVSNGRY
jgi:hypothetical protein